MHQQQKKIVPIEKWFIPPLSNAEYGGDGLAITAKFLRLGHGRLVESKLGSRCNERIKAVVFHDFECLYLLVERIVQTL